MAICRGFDFVFKIEYRILERLIHVNCPRVAIFATSTGMSYCLILEFVGLSTSFKQIPASCLCSKINNVNLGILLPVFTFFEYCNCFLQCLYSLIHLFLLRIEIIQYRLCSGNSSLKGIHRFLTILPRLCSYYCPIQQCICLSQHFLQFCFVSSFFIVNICRNDIIFTIYIYTCGHGNLDFIRCLYSHSRQKSCTKSQS